MQEPIYPLFYQFHFYLFGLIALASAVVFVTRKSPVAAALWLVNVMFCLAALYVMLDAPFLGAIQILVYAGAIMVVFLFVVMLLNLGQASELGDVRGTGGRLGAVALGLILVGELWALTRAHATGALTMPPGTAADRIISQGAVSVVSQPLFTTYLLPFEVTSILLLAAVVGAVAIGKRKETNAR